MPGMFILAIILFTFLVILLFSMPLLKSKKQLHPEFIQELKTLCELALSNGDVPIAAILVYKDQIIGRGYNQINKTQQLSKHAEVVAIEEAYINLGNDFYSLDRKDLVLYTTFEPCMMCRGTMIHYNITQVVFEKPKACIEHLRSGYRVFRFGLNSSRFKASNLQESYFRKIESYRKHHGIGD